MSVTFFVIIVLCHNFDFYVIFITFYLIIIDFVCQNYDLVFDNFDFLCHNYDLNHDIISYVAKIGFHTLVPSVFTVKNC